jgi:hypothetical protein
VVELGRFTHPLERRGDKPLLSSRAIVGHDDELLERQGAELVLQDEKLLVSSAEDDRDIVARLGHCTRDGIRDRSTHAAADDGDTPEALGVRGNAERPDDIGKRITHAEVRQLMRCLADPHEDEADPAFLGRPVAEGERDALAVIVNAQHKELPGLRLASDCRCSNADLKDGIRELALVDDREHAMPAFREVQRACGQVY